MNTASEGKPRVEAGLVARPENPDGIVFGMTSSCIIG
jgi:hypothetical protein